MSDENFPLPDNPMAVARRLLQEYRHGGIPTLRRWRGNFYQWQGTYWRQLGDEELTARLYTRLERVENVHEEIIGKGGKKHRRVVCIPWAPTIRKVRDVAAALQATTIIPDVDAPCWIEDVDHPSERLIAVRNGLLGTNSRKLYDHTPAYFNTYATPFDYNPGVAGPVNWVNFLKQLWPDDPASIDLLQEYAGYLISGATDQQKILSIVGPPRSGKGTIAKIMTGLVGHPHTAGLSMASLTSDFGLQELVGKSLAIIGDMRVGATNPHQVVERLLAISGEDVLPVNRKYQAPWSGKLGVRFILLSNELPRLTDASAAIVTRLLPLELTVSWLGREDTRLLPRLEDEYSGILKWALDGLTRLTRRGDFTLPQSAEEQFQELRELASPVQAFVEELFTFDPDGHLDKGLLHSAFLSWCADRGYRNTPTYSIFFRDLYAAFRSELRARRPRHGDNRRRIVVGLWPKDLTDHHVRALVAHATKAVKAGALPSPTLARCPPTPDQSALDSASEGPK